MRVRRGSGIGRAFTIIELLVVISIIALLIAILLPSLAGARDRARYAKWQGYSHNLRADTRALAYYNFEQQGTGHDELWNRAAGDPHLFAKVAVEPKDMEGKLGQGKAGVFDTSGEGSCEACGDGPFWKNNQDGRWRGKNALKFSGGPSITDAVRARTNPIMDDMRNRLFSMAWVSPNSTMDVAGSGPGQYIMEKGGMFFFIQGTNGGGTGKMDSQMNGIRPDTSAESVNLVKGQTTMEPGEWYMLVQYFDGNAPLNADGRARNHYYINNKVQGKQTFFGGGYTGKMFLELDIDNSIYDHSLDFWIGNGDAAAGEGFDGLIDEVLLMHELPGGSVGELEDKIDEMYRVGRPRSKE